MACRKVQNKYYPPDFDASKLSRTKKPKNKLDKIRYMLPMRICCNTCGHYIGEGTKFNARKEELTEKYLGDIRITGFYFKCTNCKAELIMKTDPQNSDYVVEYGAKRSFEDVGRKREREELGDVMKALENRMRDSKKEMDRVTNLDELKSLKARRANVSGDDMLEALKRKGMVEDKENKNLDDEKDEAIVKAVFHGPRIVRIDDGDFNEDEDLRRQCNAKRVKILLGSSKEKAASNVVGATKNPKFVFKTSSIVVSFVKKHVGESSAKELKQVKESNVLDRKTALQVLGQNY